MSGKRRKPWIVQKTIGWEWDEAKGKNIQKLATIGYAATKAEGIQMLAEYNNNPFDIKASKITFQEVYERWSKEKFPTISDSNVKGYEASYKVCGTVYNKVFKEMKLPISTTKFRRLFEIDSFARQFNKRRSVLLLAL